MKWFNHHDKTYKISNDSEIWRRLLFRESKDPDFASASIDFLLTDFASTLCEKS